MGEETGPRDALELLRLLARSWRVVVPSLAVTALLIFAVAGSVPLHYEATGKVILEPPAGRSQEANPFTNLNPSLAVVGVIIAEVVDDDAVREALHTRGATRDYSIESSELFTVPVLSIQAVSEDPAEATGTVQLVADSVEAELELQQRAAGATPDTFLTVRTLISPAGTEALYGGRIRSALACLAVGLGVTIALAVRLDARRRRRRASLRILDADPSPGPQSSRARAGAGSWN